MTFWGFGSLSGMAVATAIAVAETHLSTSTWIPAGAAALMLGAVATAAFRLSTILNKLHCDIKDTRRENLDTLRRVKRLERQAGIEDDD